MFYKITPFQKFELYFFVIIIILLLCAIFIEKLADGLTPFKIKRGELELADESITMQDILIGFY